GLASHPAAQRAARRIPAPARPCRYRPAARRRSRLRVSGLPPGRRIAYMEVLGSETRLRLSTITDETRLAVTNIADRAAGIFTPSLRLGVTGLARAGKTVFITALIHNLVHGGRLPLFRAYSSGRIATAMLQPQPDDAVPRFDYENHV